VSTWRERAAPIIAEVIRRVGRNDPEALRAAIREAYPWGERKRHPYKAWCKEVRHQLGRARATHKKDQPDLFAATE